MFLSGCFVEMSHPNDPVALLSVAVMFVRVIPRRHDVLAFGGRLNDATAVGYNGENRCLMFV